MRTLTPPSPSASASRWHRAFCRANHPPSLQTLESDSFICIRDKKDDTASPEVLIVDLKNNNNVIRRPIKADSAIMHWTRQVIALKAQSRTLQIFDLEQKQKLKSTTMSEDVAFWKWISETTLGLVTDSSIYHWDVFDPTQAAPVKVFDRHANLQVCVHAPGRGVHDR